MLSSYKKANQEIVLLLQCLITKKGFNCHGTCNEKLKLYEIGERINYCESESTKLLTNLPNLT
jgi:hypothetical protein